MNLLALGHVARLAGDHQQSRHQFAESLALAHKLGFKEVIVEALCGSAMLAAGIGDHKIVTTLCPGGKERMRRLMEVIASSRVDLRALVTHRFKLDDIEEAYEVFSNQRDGVLKVAITP